MISDNDIHFAALACLEGVGPAWLNVFEDCGDAQELWTWLAAADHKQIKEALRNREELGLKPHPRSRGQIDKLSGPHGTEDLDCALTNWSKQARSIRPTELQKRLAALDLNVLRGETIPLRLQEHQNPPPLLFTQGTGLFERRQPSEVPTVAIVGTRKATPYGLGIAGRLGRELSSRGVCIVSGLALGIDAAAHRGAVVGDAPPLAILGGGHHRPCPSRNRPLAEQVCSTGALWSEVPPGVASAPWRYPARNRIIACMADVVVVVESAHAGGSMLTVGEALQRNIDVMAVPGPVDRRASEGCLSLIRDGAQVCTGADDVLTLLGLVAQPQQSTGSSDSDTVGQSPIEITADGQTVLHHIGNESQPFDVLVERSGLGFRSAAEALSELESAGIVSVRAGWVERVFK